MSSIQQLNFYQNTPRDIEANSRSYDQLNEYTPKRLPALGDEPRYTTPAIIPNYTYVDTTKASPYSSDSESPVKRSMSAVPVTPVSVKLPSFKSLMLSINGKENQPTLSFETPFMNSLSLENSNFKALQNVSASAHSSPSIRDNESSTFLGIYNYAKVQFEDPYGNDNAASPSNFMRGESQSQQQSPLQLQQERFGSFTLPQPQFTFKAQSMSQPLNGLQQLAQVVSRNSELIQVKPAPSIPSMNTNSSSSSTEKRFKCKICSRGFNTAGNLSRHKKVHTGEKKYKCQYPGCESKFARSDSCMQHYRTHANENGYTSRRFKRLRTETGDDDDDEEEEGEGEEREHKRMNVSTLMS